MMRRQVVLLPNEWAMAAISSYDERINVLTCTGPRMQPESCDILLVTLGGRLGTDKPAQRVSDGNRGQP